VGLNSSGCQLLESLIKDRLLASDFPRGRGEVQGKTERSVAVLCQGNTVPGDASVFLSGPFNPVAGDITEGLKILSAGGIICQEIDECSAGQVFGPFFEAQDGERTYQTDSVDLVYPGLISQGERSQSWFALPRTNQTG
jgi:hypothetical protein